MPKSLRITLPNALKNPGIPSSGRCGGFNVPPPPPAPPPRAAFELAVEYAALV
eukprot:CAMPEP_0183758178 /NCGR_PEP_ID=MMETSP0739-20130205/6244_1 /TAXON_ID=385413 /ORGANISM="Thalassiosira miniscula, Strain CCMP1093" /LENGTH=52 /DNA_ID=CAMNT_0025995737 /DNA_START=49 /DNA_END=203 /DNA_ORIENTATION=+